LDRVNSHGFERTDFEHPENIGRGPQLARFRDHILRHANITRFDLGEAGSKHWKILFSVNSSRHIQRRRGFEEEISAVARSFGSRVSVEGHNMWNYSLSEQIELASKSAIFVSVVGSGTLPAYFLPKGASLILLYPTGEMLDWDVWNNYQEIFTHWIHLDDFTVDVILSLVRDELDRIESGFR
jgi:hypothetical protein